MNQHEFRDPDLRPPFEALRTAMAEFDSPPAVEAALMAAFAKQHAPRPWYQRCSPTHWILAGYLAATAFSLMLVVLTLHQPASKHPVVADSANDGVPFIALASLERIEQEPTPRVMEADVPRSTLAALGVPVNPENASDMVRAEMLVGFDGEPLALRLTASLN